MAIHRNAGRVAAGALALAWLVPANAAAQVETRRWEWRDAERPARVTLTCPDDLVVECDGEGNVADREAFMASFDASANAPCEPAELVLDVSGTLAPTLSFPDFGDLAAWTLNGVTATIGNPVDDGTRPVLRLTNDLSQSGSAFVTDPVSLAGDASFGAYFSFRISESRGTGDGDGPGADGLVFVLQTVSDTAGGLGGGIGFEGIVPSIGVEFDTYDNGAWDRSDGNHVGIDENGSVSSVQQASVARRFNDGNPWHAWVDYDGTIDVLEVRIADGPTRPDLPVLSHVVDLPLLLGTPDAFVGFTSGTGAGAGAHDILSFFFTQGLIPFTCGGTGSELVMAAATDACLDSTTCARTFTVVDTTPPTLTAAPIGPCFPDVASAEAAALAATRAEETCSLPVTLSATTTGTCDAVVTVIAEDACGNVATLDHPVRIDASAPTFTTCPAEVSASAMGPDGAVVPLVVEAADGCDGSPTVSNDRTGGGADATDLYPCGLSLVTFVVDDSCGFTSACEVLVRVTPTTPAPPVGDALRVSKDPAARPVLRWSGAPPAEWHAVLRRGGAEAPHAVAPEGWAVTATS